MKATGSFVQEEASVSCQACNSQRGGCMHVVGKFVQSKRSYADFTGCNASSNGGALSAEKGVYLGGNSRFEYSSTGSDGGCLHTEGHANFQGFAKFDRCKAARYGGAVSARSAESGARVAFEDCTARSSGGGLFLEAFHQTGGSVTFAFCEADLDGGGLYLRGDFRQDGGHTGFEFCEAKIGKGGGLCVERNGGGMRIGGNFTQLSGGVAAFSSVLKYCRDHERRNALTMRTVGAISFENCKAARGFGGGVQVRDGNFTSASGVLNFTRCGLRVAQLMAVVEAFKCMGLQRGSLFQHGGDIRFSHCKAGKGGGLALRQGSLHQFMGSLGFEDSSSGEGGGLFVGKDVLLMGGAMNFSYCQASGEGGGAVVKQDFLQHGGALVVDSCNSQDAGGGCMGVEGSVFMSGSNTFKRCVALGDRAGTGGGGLYTQETFTQLGGIINFTRCRALKSGGALRINNGSLLAKSGTMIFKKCKAEKSGGGSDVGLHVYIGPEAKMFLYACSAHYLGGGIYLNGRFFQDGGSMHFSGCQADVGGGLAVFGSYLHQQAGRMHFLHCHAAFGGGIWVQENMTVGSSVVLSKCNASVGGNASMEYCRSIGSGGGLLMGSGGVRQQAGSRLSFRHCSARGGNGGGMSAYSFASQGFTEFASCVASSEDSGGGSGGGFYISSGNGTIQQSRGRMSLTNCTAEQRGGGFYLGSTVPGDLRDISFDRCGTYGDAGTFYAKSHALNVSNLTVLEPRSVDFDIISEGKLALQDLHLHSSNRKFGMGIWSGNLHAGTVNCTLLKWCSLVAPERHVDHLHCPAGTGIQKGDDFSNCSVCEDNFTVLPGHTQSKCVPCPTHNDFCYVDKFKMTPGHMVQKPDISLTIFCPNPAACPGGNSTDFSTMCAPGYQGRACARCTQGYSISDSSVLICTRCATDFWRKLLQWAYMLAKHILPFAVAAYSALQVEDAEEVKRSGVLINQLLSFATVAGTLLILGPCYTFRRFKQVSVFSCSGILDYILGLESRIMVAQTNAMREIKLTAATLKHLQAGSSMTTCGSFRQ
ncbi:unnamed protein product [Symbiodinium necroappetens]|uniref:Uncharacterized protein n=1 Tax=Symbiodinium necroappetens TaxID=1628268 RepID=A0A813BJU7_9DINO|nr:unnamed protein product [Symbiodinium necroappetens]